VERERLARWRCALAIANFSHHVHIIPGFPLRVSAKAPKRASEALALPQQLAAIAVDFVLTRPRRRGFVDRAHHCPDRLDDAVIAVTQAGQRDGSLTYMMWSFAGL